MNVPLVLAGFLALLGAAIHGAGGEILVVRRLSPGMLPSTPFGSPATTKAMIRATLRSMEALIKNESEAIAYLQRDFALEPKIAADTYKILRQIVNSDGDIEDAVLKSILDKIKQESGITGEVPADRLVDLSLLREVHAEMRKR